MSIIEVVESVKPFFQEAMLNEEYLIGSQSQDLEHSTEAQEAVGSYF